MPRLCVSAQIAAAAVTAAVIGLLDAALVTTRLLGAARSFQFVPTRIWVVAPVTWLAVAALTCLLVLPVMRRWGGVCVPAALTIFFLAYRLQWHVALLVGALAAFVLLLAVTSGWMLRWMGRPRRAIAYCIAGAAVAAAVVAAAPVLRPSSVAARRGGTGPNVIVIFLDTLRYDAVLDADGRVLDRLPTLARLRGDSTAFTRAYTASPWTLPAHLSAVTGLPAYRLGVSFDSQVYHRTDETLAERFHRRGYRTAAVISNTFLNVGTGFARGFDTFQQAQAGLDLCRTAPGGVADDHWPWFSAAVCNWTGSDVTRRALALMDDEDGPFFLTLNYMDAH